MAISSLQLLPITALTAMTASAGIRVLVWSRWCSCDYL